MDSVLPGGRFNGFDEMLKLLEQVAPAVVSCSDTWKPAGRRSATWPSNRLLPLLASSMWDVIAGGADSSKVPDEC